MSGSRAADPHQRRRPAEPRAAARGALFAGTLDLLDAVGVETADLRGDSRALVFETRRAAPGDDAALGRARPTSRPAPPTSGSPARTCSSSRPTAPSTSSSTSATAPAGWCSPARRGDPALDEAERRLGAMRIATKYPRTAERHFERTGRQAEVIEVKGSVELAPLVGLADGIVDLVDTGRTLAENELEVREEIAACTARLVANRVAHKLRAAEIDAPRRAPAGGGPDEARADRVGRRRRRGARRRGCARSCRALEDVAPEVAEIVARGRRQGDAALRELAIAFGETPPERLRVDPERIAAAPGLLDAGGPRRHCGRPRPTSTPSPAAELERLERPATAELAAGTAGRGRRRPRSPRPASTRPAGAAPTRRRC